jgi:hypothetical protein
VVDGRRTTTLPACRDHGSGRERRVRHHGAGDEDRRVRQMHNCLRCFQLTLLPRRVKPGERRARTYEIGSYNTPTCCKTPRSPVPRAVSRPNARKLPRTLSQLWVARPDQLYLVSRRLPFSTGCFVFGTTAAGVAQHSFSTLRRHCTDHASVRESTKVAARHDRPPISQARAAGSGHCVGVGGMTLLTGGSG